MSTPILSPDYNEGYPSPVLINVKSIKFTVDGYYISNISFNDDINEGYPSQWQNITDMKVQTKPYPKILPTLDYPDCLEGYPSKGQILDWFGAFSNIPTLAKVVIPRSVKYISDYAFYNTGVKSVTIHPECVYGEHTFPEDCEIYYYDTDE